MGLDNIVGDNSGCLVYKCRRCNKLDKSINVPDIGLAMLSLVSEKTLPNMNGGSILSKVSVHYCKDDNLGIMDIIGAEKK